MALDKLNRIYCFVIIRYNDIFEWKYFIIEHFETSWKFSIYYIMMLSGISEFFKDFLAYVICQVDRNM